MNENSRQFKLEHCTIYRYTEPVLLSHQQLHLTPRPLNTQRIDHHEVTIQPEPTVRHDIADAFGNPLTEIAMESAHRTLDIMAKTSVTVSAPDSLESAKDAPWEQIRDRLRYRAGWHPDTNTLEATQFLFESPHVRVKRSLRAYASVCFTEGRPMIEAATALMAKIHSEFKYDAKATTVATPVMQFFVQKRGVCQDFAHLMISCLRSTGLAARYISGYILTRSGPGEPSHVGAEASHAWVSLYIPEHGWVDFDPTNNLMPSTEHITLGWGRDFSDVTPLRGVINGGGEQRLEVKVTVEPV